MRKPRTLDSWIAEDTISFTLDSQEIFDSAIDKLVTSLDSSVRLLGFGEALHGGEEILRLRHRLFQRLVEAHNFSAIAIESSFPRAHITNEYVSGRGPKSYEEVKAIGFGQGLGDLEANQELIEWMKAYNAQPEHKTKLRFYGFDIPTGTIGIASPRQVLNFVLDYLSPIDNERTQERREQIEKLLGQDAIWENPAAHMDPAKSIGLSANATALRIETEDLIAELKARRPELIEKSGKESYLEALQHAKVARGLLNFHASMAKRTGYSDRLNIRDALQAECLVYMVSREQGRGKVFAFAHNGHLKKGKAEWQLGEDTVTWWAAGSQLNAMLGSQYAVIGTAVGVSDENGIGQPEADTLEARLTSTPGPMRFIPTHGGEGLPAASVTRIPVRSGSQKNPTYFPLTAQSFTDFDWLAVIDSTGYNRGGPSLQDWDADANE